MSAAHHELASGTADVQVFTGRTVLAGYSIREAATTAAAATVIIRDGTAASDPIVTVIELAANASETTVVPGGVTCTDGVFVERVTGTTEGSVWLG